MWVTFWFYWLAGSIVVGAVVALICLFGGIFDLIAFIRDLKAMGANPTEEDR